VVLDVAPELHEGFEAAMDITDEDMSTLMLLRFVVELLIRHPFSLLLLFVKPALEAARTAHLVLVQQ